jgi:hypothetical protein
VFGDFGCQAYSIAGFVFGMESIFGIGLIITDLYLMTYSKKLSKQSQVLENILCSGTGKARPVLARFSKMFW